MQRRLSWSLIATATAVVLLVTPQAQATHLPGFGHDNTIPAGYGTGALCNVFDVCFLAYNSANGYNAVGVIGKHTSFNGGGGPAPYSAGVVGETNSQAPNAVGVYGRVAYGGQPGSGSAGVRGDNNSIYGDAVGVLGWNDGKGGGVWGHSELGTGVSGDTNSSATGASGVSGSSYYANTRGVNGASDYGIGVRASSCCGTALQVDGKATVAGPATFQNGVAVSGKSSFANQTSFQNGVVVNGKSTWSRSGVLTLPGASSFVTKTGISLGAGSYVLATMQTDVPGVFVTSAVPDPSASTITINFNSTAPVGTRVAWFVIN
jgi:hypothetical protein